MNFDKTNDIDLSQLLFSFIYVYESLKFVCFDIIDGHNHCAK
jgi:hypothetical protein